MLCAYANVKKQKQINDYFAIPVGKGWKSLCM